MLAGNRADRYDETWGDLAGRQIPEEEWNAVEHGGIDERLRDEYRFNLFGLLSFLTQGDAKAMITSMCEDGEEERVCGFKVLWLFKRRWSVQTFSTKLLAFLKVVNPSKMKDETEIVGAINSWEAEVLALKKRLDEKVSESMKTAILIAILPKDLQDNLYERGHVTEYLTYEAVRELVIRISNNKQQRQQPTPMDIGAADNSNV